MFSLPELPAPPPMIAQVLTTYHGTSSTLWYHTTDQVEFTLPPAHTSSNYQEVYKEATTTEGVKTPPIHPGNTITAANDAALNGGSPRAASSIRLYTFEPLPHTTPPTPEPTPRKN